MGSKDFCNDPTCDLVRAGEIHPPHDVSESNKRRLESLKNVLDLGTKMTGGMIGAAAGFMIAGPPGALVGTIIGQSFEYVGKEISQRYLSSREKIRIGATFILTINKIKEEMENGRQLRTDDFFKDKPTERSAAKEIMEGVLLSAQREYEEKKLPFYSNLLANIAFHSEIDRAHANSLIRLGERLSYRQLCVLSLFVQKSKFNLRQGDYRSSGISGADKAALLQEIYELASEGILNASGEAMLGVTDVNPAKMNIQGRGVTLYNLMELSRIDVSDLKDLERMLQ